MAVSPSKVRVVYWVRWPAWLLAVPLLISCLIYDSAFGVGEKPIGFVLLALMATFFTASAVVRVRAYEIQKNEIVRIAGLPGRRVEMDRLVAIQGGRATIFFYSRSDEGVEMLTANAPLFQYAPRKALHQLGQTSGAVVSYRVINWPDAGFERRLSAMRRSKSDQLVDRPEP